MADLTFTTIEEPARAALGITRDDYALCNYVQTWSSHPENRQPGFCDRTRQQMADFIGITTRGAMKMLDRLERRGLIERYSEARFLHRITSKWFDTVTLAKAERKGEQSSPEKENKVPPKRRTKFSLKENKVPPHKEYKDLHKEEEEAASLSSSRKTSFPLEAEPHLEEKLPAPAVTVLVTDPELPGARIYDCVPHKGYPTQEPQGEWNRVDIREEIDRLKADGLAREAFTIGRKIPSAHYEEYVEAFRVDIAGRGEKYASARQLRSHFFNWCGSKWERAQRTAKQAAQQHPTTGQPAKIRQL